MLRSGLALLMILLAAPAFAGSRAGGGFHGGGAHAGGALHGGGFHGGDFNDRRTSAFRRSGGRAHALFGVYGLGYGYNCGFGFDCGVYDPGYGYSYGGGAGNAVSSSSAVSSSGGYVPDPVGADIPPVTFPSSCWVRRAGYDPAGAYVGQVLIDLCHHSDSVTVTRVDVRAKPPNTGAGAPQSPQ